MASFAMTLSDPHCENRFGALPQNFSMQEKIFYIEKYWPQIVDFEQIKICLV